jgi:hypothetical protein
VSPRHWWEDNIIGMLIWIGCHHYSSTPIRCRSLGMKLLIVFMWGGEESMDTRNKISLLENTKCFHKEWILQLLSWQNHHWQRIVVSGITVPLFYQTLILWTWYNSEYTFDNENWGVRELEDADSKELLDLSWMTESFAKTWCKETLLFDDGGWFKQLGYGAM